MLRAYFMASRQSPIHGCPLESDETSFVSQMILALFKNAPILVNNKCNKKERRCADISSTI